MLEALDDFVLRAEIVDVSLLSAKPELCAVDVGGCSLFQRVLVSLVDFLNFSDGICGGRESITASGNWVLSLTCRRSECYYVLDGLLWSVCPGHTVEGSCGAGGQTWLWRLERDAIEFGKKRGCLKTGDSVVVVTGWRKGSGATNTIRLIPVE